MSQMSIGTMETKIINKKECRSQSNSTSSEDSKRKYGEGCQEKYNRCSHVITHFLEDVSYRFGYIIGKYPWTTILVTMIIFIAMSCGLLKFQRSTDDEFLWTPYGSDFVDQNAWIKENYPKDMRYESIIVYSKNGTSGNILTAASIQYLHNLQEAVVNLTSSDGKNLSDLCLPITPKLDDKCSIISLLGLFANDNVENLDDEMVLKRITWAMRNDMFPSTAAFVSNLLSNITWDSDHTSVISASAYMTTWILRMPENDSYVNSGGSYVDPIAESWEKEFIDLIATDSGYIKGGDVNTNGDAIEGKPDYIQVELLAERSFDDGINDVLRSNNAILYFGGVLLLIFIMVVLGRFNSIEQRVFLSLMGMVVIGLGLLASFGFCFYTGWFFADMHPIIPFLLLGIGVDDMFVIVKSMDNLSPVDKRLPATERVALSLKSAGVSITVTSITNMFAFLIGATSSMPIVRSFCIFCGMGIFFLYFFSVTFFVACMALDEKRIDARKSMNCACIEPKPDTWQPSRINDVRIGKYIFEMALPKLVFNIPSKVIVIIATLVLFGFGMYGVSKMESEYDPVIYMDERSYQRRYFNSLETYFPEAGERVEIYIGNIEYWKFDVELKEVQDVISENPSIRNNSLNYWYTPFHDSCCREETNIISISSSETRCTTEIDFKQQLGKFLTGNCTDGKPGSIYLNNMKLAYNNYPEDLISGDFNITATRATFQHTYLPDTPSQNEAVKSVKDSLSSIHFENQTFESPIAYAFMYIQWEANEIMGSQLTRNLSLTFIMVIILTFIFVPNIQVSIPTLACVSFTVLDLYGFCYYLGFSVEFVTTIIIILSVGLAIDYCVHISIAYMCYTDGTRNEKAKRALGEMGGAVFNGGFSTFLAFVMLSTSKSYVYETFFEMFALVLLFGLFHGLIFLPVLLSLIGPQNDENAKQMKGDVQNVEDGISRPYNNNGFSPELTKGVNMEKNMKNSEFTSL